jgi:hypothetical protein
MKIIIALTLVFVSHSISANSCWKDHDFDLEKAIKQAELVFTGEVTSTRITTFKYKGSEPYVEAVQAFFDEAKGLDGEKLGTIELDLKGVCSCRYQFEIGVQYVVLAIKMKSGKYSVRDCQHIFTREGFELYRGKK